MTNPRDNSKVIGADGGRQRRSSRRRRSQTSLNLRDAFRSGDQSTSGSASPTSVRTATSSLSNSLHGGGDASQGTVQVDGRDGRLTRMEMLGILQAAIDMSNESVATLSDSGRPTSGNSEDNGDDSDESSMQ